VDRKAVLKELADQEIYCLFHYVPLHDSPAGKKYARVHDSLPVTEDISNRLIRLPLWVGIPSVDQELVVDSLSDAIDNAS